MEHAVNQGQDAGNAKPDTTSKTFDSPQAIRNNWTYKEIEDFFSLPFNDLLFEAQKIHRLWFDANQVQMSTLLSIKTGGCPEDCSYCSQSVKFKTGLDATSLMDIGDVLKAAENAKAGGASRFCMGAAWRNPKDRDLKDLCVLIEGVSALGLETCMTLGMLTLDQAEQLKNAGLDYYNHNIDSTPS